MNTGAASDRNPLPQLSEPSDSVNPAAGDHMRQNVGVRTRRDLALASGMGRGSLDATRWLRAESSRLG